MSLQSPLSDLKRLLFPLLLFSFVGNVAVLVSPVFMMQVLDRVVPSGNLNTLIMLLTVALIALSAFGFVEWQKTLCLERAARWVERVGTERMAALGDAERPAMISQTASLRHFFQAGAANAALNLPWLPVFLLALGLIHPFFLLLLAGVISLMFLLKTAVQLLTGQQKQRAANIRAEERQLVSDIGDPQVRAGYQAITDNLLARFCALQLLRQEQEESTATVTSFFEAMLVMVRMGAQLCALGLGASLVVKDSLSAGGMIGASIIMAKTIQIVESSMSALPEIRSARKAFSGFNAIYAKENKPLTEIGQLSGKLTVKGLIHPRGGGAPPRLDRVSFEIQAGQCLAIVGDSGSGKTTLLHALSGIEPCPIGAVFLDETEVRTLGHATALRMIGYLPQQARLIKGTLAENISCFALEADDKRLIKAAKTAGVHGLISALPDAYETNVGTSSHLLSAGQMQRVALARAIYQQPKYLFLDEPNALLDAAGEKQLCTSLAHLKEQGTTIVMVLHRSGIMGLADRVLMLDQGRMADFGDRTEVLGRMSAHKRRVRLPLVTTSLQDLNDWIESQFMRSSDMAFCQKATLICTEIFNIACQSSAEPALHHGIFTFKFIDDRQCEISLQEDGPTEAAAKMPKIKSLIAHEQVSMMDLPSDEISLAVVSQLTTAFAIKNVKGGAVFAAAIASDSLVPEGVPKH